jgi:RHS repeat-associated protein
LTTCSRADARARFNYPFLTQYERDGETGLDYAQARYYASAQGRFTSVDPIMASARATAPQSWNRYSYVLNKPLNLIDPSGLSARSSDGGCSAEFSNCDEEESGSQGEQAYEDRLQVWKKLTFTAVTTSKIRVMVNAAVDGIARICEVEAWGPVPPVNVALTANGASATAQNYTADVGGSHYRPADAVDGIRYAPTAPPPGDIHDFWRDEHGLPSWLQIDFNGQRTIAEIDVFTLRQDILTQADPSPTDTFNNYGVTAFDVQYWTGSSWQTVPGGSITNNNLVWKKLTFTPVTTSKVRVVVNAAVDGVARICEVEAWATASSSATANINWLVADQLGTPRMVFDKTGSLAATKRHDYLPFGEELSAGQGARTTALGYATDSVRQKFTLYERDNETNLDFAQARYYSSPQGRFTGVDPVMMTEDRLYDPQQINLYAYCRNNPLAFIDPTGETISFNDKDSEEAFNEYEKFINKDPKKYAIEIATLKQLRDSDVNYIPVLGGKQASETAEGNTVPDAAGENILVRIRNVGGPQGEKLDRNGRFAHELEHARQFDSGELAFGRAQDGTWYPLSYDIYDEVNAYNSIIRVAPPIKDTPLLKSLRDDRNDDNYRARILTNSYRNLRNRQEPTNQDRAWGAKPGELVRPAANRPFFGRVYDPSRGQKR